MTSERLFKGTVLLLGLPAILLPVIVSVLVLARLAPGRSPGIGSFTFALTRSELATIAGIVLAAFIFLCVVGLGVAIRYRRRKSRLTR